MQNQQTTAAEAPASFLSLPSELRNEIYELTLLHDEPVEPCGYGRHQELTPGLLCANKVVHGEASSIFYGQNRFNLIGATSEEVHLFLEQIGCKNALYIRHILIDFPGFLDLDPGKITFEEDSVGILASIWKNCANLSTLTTSLHSTSAMEATLDNSDNNIVANEALKTVDTHFRTIPSLKEIVLDVYEDGPSGYIRERMKSHGWTLRTIANVEEEDWGEDWRDMDDDDYDYDYGYDDYGDEDEYDIDDDSDFWRRAAD